MLLNIKFTNSDNKKDYTKELEKALVHSQQGKPEKAKKIYYRVIAGSQDDDTCIVSSLGLGAVEFEEGQYETSRKIFSDLYGNKQIDALARARSAYYLSMMAESEADRTKYRKATKAFYDKVHKEDPWG